jgi:hypothetical protein
VRLDDRAGASVAKASRNDYLIAAVHLPGNEDMTTPKHCPLCAIAEALPKLADLAELIDQDNEKAHDLLKKTGDELTDVLDYFTEHAHESPFHPTQH